MVATFFEQNLQLTYEFFQNNVSEDLVMKISETYDTFKAGEQGVLDEHENSNKENPRNREPGCIYTIEYANCESSSLFFYNPSRETVVYCQSRLHYCYKATVRRSNE
jgi:hypothetical protein